MQIQEHQHGAVTVIQPCGPLNQEHVEVFRQRLDGLIERCMGRVVIDASAVPFADSPGLEALVDAAQRLADSGQVLRLCAVGPTLREVLELTGLSPGFEYFEDANQAVRSFL